MCQLLVQSLRDAHSRYWNGEDNGELSLQPAFGGSVYFLLHVLLKRHLNPRRVFPVVTAQLRGAMSRFGQHSNLILMTFFTVNLRGRFCYHLTDL